MKKNCNVVERTMTTGAGGCHRCGGWVMRSVDHIRSEDRVQPCLKCLLCGARRYLEDMPDAELKKMRGRGRTHGMDVAADPRSLALYAYTPVGKRMVRCGCNDSFNAHDEGTACFDEGPRSEPCEGCGYYPWYRIEAATGGVRRPGDERDSFRSGKQRVEGGEDGSTI